MNPIEVESHECGTALPGKSVVRWLVAQSSGRSVTALILVIDKERVEDMREDAAALSKYPPARQGSEIARLRTLTRYAGREIGPLSRVCREEDRQITLF